MGISASVAYTVQNLLENQYEVEVKYEDMNLAIDAGSGLQEFGSALESSGNRVNDLMKKMTDKTFSMKISQAGKVSDIRGMDKIFEGLFESMDEELSEAQIAEIKAQLEDSYGEDALVSNIEQAFSFLPDHPVAVGDEWETVSKLNVRFPAEVVGKFRLKEMNNDHYVISNESSITLSEDEPIVANGVEMTMSLDGIMEGDMNVDRKTGWIIKSTMHQDFGGKVMMGSSMLQGMEMPMKITSKTVITSE